MDEGFTSYIQTLAEQQVLGLIPQNTYPFEDAYEGYLNLVQSGLQEPTITHSDRYATNYAYSIAAYYKGQLFLTQLDYLMGNEALLKTLKRYYREFAFKNPTPNDFIRIAEKVSGLQLQWFLNEFMQTDHIADYAIDKVTAKGNKTTVTLKRLGRLPLSIDLFVTDKSWENSIRICAFTNDLRRKNLILILLTLALYSLLGAGVTSLTLLSLICH